MTAPKHSVGRSRLEREFSPCTRRRRISSLHKRPDFELQMQTLFNTKWLPAETERRRAQALEVH